MQDMFLIIVPEALQAHQDQIGRVDSDGTVRAVHDDLGGIFDPAQDADVSLPVQHLTDHVGDLAEANTAGHALAAGLSLTQVQKIQGHIHRAQARGLAAILPSMFRYSCSTTACAWLGVFTSNLLMICLPFLSFYLQQDLFPDPPEGLTASSGDFHCTLTSAFSDGSRSYPRA